MTTVAVHEGVPPWWAPLAATGPLFASPGWLRAMDGRLGEPPRVFAVDDGGRVALAAFGTVQRVPRPGEFFDLWHVLAGPAPGLPLTPAARERREALCRTAPPAPRWLPALVMMLPGYECVPVGDPAYTGELVDGVLRWAADRDIATVAWLYVRPDAALDGVLAARGYRSLPLSVTWDLPVRPGGLPGYLAALPRKRRSEAEREMARMEEGGVTVGLLGPELDGTVFDRLVDLRCQLVRKYRSGADVAVEAGRLRVLVDDVCAGRPAVVTAASGPDVLSFALFAPWGRDWHCLAVGSDYTDPRSRYAYFATAYYGAVAAAAAAGVRSIGYGQGASEAKRSRGCVGTPLRAYVHSTDSGVAEAVRASADVTRLGC